MKSQVLAVAALTSDPHNARRHPKRNVEAIAASLEKFGQQKPIVIDADGVVIAGNGTLEAARLLGWKKLAVVRSDLRGDAARAFALADNRTAELAEWDAEELAGQLGALDLELRAAAGWTVKELAAMSATEPEGGAPKPDDDEEPATLELPAIPETRPGDLYVLGNHRLLCGDSFEPADRVRLLEGLGPLDAVVTDPPYAIYGSSTGVSSEVADDKMVIPFFERLATLCRDTCRLFAHVYWCCDWRSWSAVWRGACSVGLSPKNMIVWDKQGSGLGNNYANTHELVAFFALLPKSGTMRGTKKVKAGQRAVFRPNVMRFPRTSGEERPHNASKPVPFFSELITNSSDPGELVADWFGGGGTTLIACEKLGRRCAMMEMEPKWCDVIVRRWEKLTGKKAERHRPEASKHGKATDTNGGAGEDRKPTRKRSAEAGAEAQGKRARTAARA